MGKTDKDSTSEIHLAGWLDLFNLGQQEAADIAGCTQSYIANIAGGRKPDVNVQIMLRLSKGMGLTVNDLFVPAPTEDNASSMVDLSAEARETVVKRWKELRQNQAQKPIRRKTSGNR